MKTFKQGLFIFRRDLRLIDNIGLKQAYEQCEKLFLCFIFTPEQVQKNDYKSDASVLFMIQSLEDLEKQIKNKGGHLNLHFAQNQTVVEQYIDKWGIDGIFFNQDYSPYALKRDDIIEKICEKQKVELKTYQDYYLYDIITEKEKKIYKKFTPYYKSIINTKVEKPSLFEDFKFHPNPKPIISNKITLKEAKSKFINDENLKLQQAPGRIEALKKLDKACQEQKQYETNHNFLTHHTTQLSVYIKFGLVSIREVYHALKNKYGINSGIVRQLVWREFYATILYFYPEVLNGCLKPNYNKVKWEDNEKYFEAWKNGQTGFPVVDACMKELNMTGEMHNRGRLIVSSFLVKTLLINWQKGEQFFAQKLLDYDPAQNNGNWQWMAGGGADSQPYFRVFNPWSQSQKSDPNAEYIKKWLPELKDVPKEHIHQWNMYYKQYKKINYPQPIVDYKVQKEQALAMYKKVFE